MIDFVAIRAALTECDVDAKGLLVAALPIPVVEAMEPSGSVSGIRIEASDPHIPGRPEKPTLLHPRDVPSRGLGTVVGRAALAHAVAHIEFNAINLALDAAWRFRGLPSGYYADWISVAQDEARHFAMLRNHMRALGYDYGDFAAHNGLWEAAEKTAHDLLSRMACVPRVLEARGLDVTPGMISRLREVGDQTFADILGVILIEEVRHVAIGTRWFRWLCEGRGLDPAKTFAAQVAEQGMCLRPPMNRAARTAAGFEAAELELFR